jgi:hypothetical protein
MPRPPRADRPQDKTISLPTSLCGKVDLLLFSPLEGRVPHGAWARYITGLIEQDLEQRAAFVELSRVTHDAKSQG